MLESRYVSEYDLRDERGPQLLQYLLEQGADAFSITVMALQDTLAPFADAFEDELGPYERPADTRRVPGTKTAGRSTQSMRLWLLDTESLRRLMTFIDAGIMQWPAGPDGWLEDLRIYRRGELLLGLVSHEREGVLRLTHQEHAAVAAMDIPSKPVGTSINYL